MSSGRSSWFKRNIIYKVFRIFYKKCPEGNFHPIWDRECHCGDGTIFFFKEKYRIEFPSYDSQYNRKGRCFIVEKEYTDKGIVRIPRYEGDKINQQGE